MGKRRRSKGNGSEVARIRRHVRHRRWEELYRESVRAREFSIEATLEMGIGFMEFANGFSKVIDGDAGH